jgi:hypothetical protein
MEYWNSGTNLYPFFILHSAIHLLHSAIEGGGDLMLWIMGGPVRGIDLNDVF